MVQSPIVGVGGGIRVFAADDHPLYREGLARAITLRSELVLVGQASSGCEALERIRTLEPDVAVLDIRMPDLGGLEVLHAVVRDATPTRVVLLTAFDASALVYEALSGGAAGYVPKHAGRDEICDVIVAVAGGRTVICPELQTSFVEEVRAREPSNRKLLSSREHEVLVLTAGGLSRTQIGDKMFLSPHTVKTHLENIYEKLGVSDRAAMVAEAMRRNLIE